MHSARSAVKLDVPFSSVGSGWSSVFICSRERSVLWVCVVCNFSQSGEGKKWVYFHGDWGYICNLGF